MRMAQKHEHIVLAIESVWDDAEKKRRVQAASSVDYAVKPRPMSLVDIPRASLTSVESLVGDPVTHYIRDTPDKRGDRYRLRMLWGRLVYSYMWFYFIRKRTAWTVDNGQANLGYTDPKQNDGKFDDTLMQLIYSSQVLVNTKEQNKRYAEFRDKVENAAADAIGPRKEQMLLLNTIATTPFKQGRGYGTALVKVLNTKADMESRATWLVSSNQANIGFYNFLKFQTVARVFLGDDNPEWHEEPVPVDIMVREPQDARQKV